MTCARPGAALFAVLALASSALAQDSFVGKYELKGKFSSARVGEWSAMGDAERTTSAEVSVVTSSSGSLTVTRTGRYTGTRWLGDTRAKTPPFTWSGEGRVVGDELRVTYRVAPAAAGLAALGAAPTGGAYVFEATYRLYGSRTTDTAIFRRFWPSRKKILLETVANTTAQGEHAFWRSLWTRGPRVSTTPTPPRAP